jgi:Transposase.
MLPKPPSEYKKGSYVFSKFKAMLIVLFDIQGVVKAVWVPIGQTVHHHYYIEMLTKFA